MSATLFQAWWYWIRLGFVGGVSAYDTYLVFVCREVILFTEQNPMGRWLISLDPHGLVYFTAAKTAGTAAVLAIMGVAAPMASGRGRAGPSPPLATLRSQTAFNLPQRELLSRFGRTLRRHREPIMSSLATFQLWLLWYLCYE